MLPLVIPFEETLISLKRWISTERNLFYNVHVSIFLGRGVELYPIVIFLRRKGFLIVKVCHLNPLYSLGDWLWERGTLHPV